MPSEELKQAEILKNEGKFNEALKELNNIEEKGGLSSSELLYLHLLKGSVLYIIGKFSEAIDSSELAYRKSKELMKGLQSIDALIIKGNALTRLGDTKNAMEVIVQGEELLKAVKVEDPIEITKRKGSIATSKGLVYYFLSNPKATLNNLLLGLKLLEEVGDKNEIAMSLLLIGMAYTAQGNFEEALNYAERCQQMTDEITDKTIIAYSFSNHGGISAMRGELDQSMDDYKQALEILEEFNHTQAIGVCLGNIGEVYRYKGNYRKALKYYEESVLLIEKTGNINWLSSLLVDLCLLALDIGDTKLAHDYLGRIQEFSEQSENKRIKGSYNLCKALILKTSSRASNRAESEEIL
ncbi:MAG: tetratricopeptide repeat protein, partial [Promethearchaeota archaeon]